MAQDGFTQMIDDSNAFFADLKQNNTKDWFNPRKDHYNERIKKPAEFFADLLADDFSRISGVSYKPKLFRIYRDVRFSKDKTPLNTHLHILWSPITDNPLAPLFFFGSEPGDMRVGFGLFSPKGEALARLRAFFAASGDAFEEAVEATGMTWSTWGNAALKRVPKPYDQDHPHAELLKKKSVVLNTVFDDSWRETEGGLLKAVLSQFEATNLLRVLMNERLSAER